MRHRDRHSVYVEGCFACKALSVGVSAQATPTRRPDVVEIDAREARWQRDMPAYKALRADGLQPRQIDGCAELQATARTEAEVEGRPA